MNDINGPQTRVFDDIVGCWIDGAWKIFHKIDIHFHSSLKDKTDGSYKLGFIYRTRVIITHKRPLNKRFGPSKSGFTIYKPRIIMACAQYINSNISSRGFTKFVIEAL